MNDNAVAIVKANGDIPSTLNRGLDLIGGFKVSNGEKIVIKPNLCAKSPPEAGATTDVRIVQALVRYILDKAKCSVSIVESDSYARDCERPFEKLGYKDLEKTPHVYLANLSSEETTTTDFQGKFFKKIQVPKTLSSYDFFITVAKLKTAIIHGMSGAYKNQFGCLAVKEKRSYHPFLNEVLFDLNTFLKPNLCVVDGIVGMEGCGPTDGSPKSMGVILLGKDPVAIDAVSCHIMGIDPFKIPHLKYAFENDLGEIRIENIHLLGEPLENVRTMFTLVPERAYSWMSRGLKLGRYPPPIKNLGILLFTWGNYKAGEKSLVRAKRHRKKGGRPSAWSFLKKALWTRRWNV